MAELTDLITMSIKYVKEYTSHLDASHDFAHIKRVLALSHHLRNELIATEGRTNLHTEYTPLCALLHDVGDKKYLQPGQDGETVVRDLLLSFGAEAATAEKIQTMCSAVSYTSEIKDEQKVLDLIALHPEIALVQDADRLDAIGAIGIGRLFTYGGAKTGRSMDEAMAFMEDDGKLVLLERLMKTPPGRKLARERTRRILAFRDWYAEERLLCGTVGVPVGEESGALMYE